MIVYNSMFLVVFVLMLVYKMQVPNLQQRLTQPIPWPYAIIAMGYITFWAALRSGIADTRTYIWVFENSSSSISDALSALNSDGKSPGWDCIQILFKAFVSHDFHYWLATIAIATGIPIMITMRKKSDDYLFSVFLFLASGTFTWMVNGIRQFLVVAIMFACWRMLVDRKRIWFVIIVLLCSTVHTTALIMLPAIFFVDWKPFGKIMMLFVVVVLASAFFVGPLLDSMDTMLQGTAYHGNLDQFQEDDGVHPLRVLFETVPVIMALIKRKQIAALNDSFINIAVNMSTVAAGLFFIGMLTSGIMVGRLPMYFSIYNMVLIPLLINKVYTPNRKVLYTGFFIVYITFYFVMNQNAYYVSDILGNYF